MVPPSCLRKLPSGVLNNRLMDYTQFVSDKSEMGEQVWLNPRIFLFLFIDGSQRVGQITIKDRGWKKKCRLQDPNPEFLLTGSRWGLWICIWKPPTGPRTPYSHPRSTPGCWHCWSADRTLKTTAQHCAAFHWKDILGLFYILLSVRFVIQEEILENHLKDEILFSDEFNFIKFLVFMHVEITHYGN